MSLRTAVGHRNLLYLLALKELRTRYKKSVLGWAWSMLNPLSQMLIFSVIFLYVFVADPPVGDPSGIKNFPLYFLCGLIPFNYFSISVGTAIGAVQGGAGLIKKVQFPHEHLVFSVVLAQFVTLLIELLLLTVALLIGGNMVLPWLPVLFVVLALLTLFSTGLALALAAANVFYHDVAYLWGIALPIIFYSTPILFTPDIIKLGWLKWFTNYGPMGSFIRAIHEILYDLRMPAFGRFLHLTLMSLAMFAFGMWVFGKLSPRFAEEM